MTSTTTSLYAVLPGERSATKCWPYPLLCLLWRLDLAGQWLLAPTAVSSQALLETSERLLTAHRDDPSLRDVFVDREALERRVPASAHTAMVLRAHSCGCSRDRRSGA